MSLRRLLDHTVTVHRRSEARDAYGDVVVTWPAVAGMTGAQAGVQRRGARLVDQGAGVEEEGTHDVFMLPHADVQADDVLEVTAGPEMAASPLLRVLSVARPRGHHTELAAEKWEGSLS